MTGHLQIIDPVFVGLQIAHPQLDCIACLLPACVNLYLLVFIRMEILKILLTVSSSALLLVLNIFLKDIALKLFFTPSHPVYFPPGSCGTSDCTTYTGFQCKVSISKCSRPFCEEKTGMLANTRDCICSSSNDPTDSVCTTTTGLYCDASAITNKCWDGSVQGEFRSVESGTCKAISATYIVRNDGDCVRAFKSIYQTSRSPSQKNKRQWPPGCLTYGSSTLYMNAHDPGSNCFTDYRCVCWTGPPCANSDSSQPNLKNCMCGNNICSGKNLFLFYI